MINRAVNVFPLRFLWLVNPVDRSYPLEMHLKQKKNAQQIRFQCFINKKLIWCFCKRKRVSQRFLLFFGKCSIFWFIMLFSLQMQQNSKSLIQRKTNRFVCSSVRFFFCELVPFLFVILFG